MSKSYSQFNRYISGNLKIKGIDFKSWGYLAAVRSLEITLGLIFITHIIIFYWFLNKLEINNKNIINTYSYNNGKLSNHFFRRRNFDSEDLVFNN